MTRLPGRAFPALVALFALAAGCSSLSPGRSVDNAVSRAPETPWQPPAEARLPMDPRTRDFVRINGRPYQRQPLDEQWILTRWPADLPAARRAA